MTIQSSTLDLSITIGLSRLWENIKGALAPSTMYKVPPVRSVDTLPQLLSSAAATSGRCIFYSAGEDGNLLSESTSYAELLMEAAEKASRIASIPGLAPDSVLLLHFASQRENIVWFWAVTLAGFLPTISTALVKDDDQRKAHLERLHTLLRSPTFITSKRLAAEFQGVPQLTIQYIETLDSVSAGDPISNLSQLNKTARDVAVLMLTSGSTGGAKAVPLRHGQIIKSLQGKSSHHGTAPGHVFLNWVGLDHVASLLEIHLHSMSLGSNQIHVPAAVLLREPLQFIKLLDTHGVAYTFAPNFFLAKLQIALAAKPHFTADLCKLEALISGGESNVVETCHALTLELARLGANGQVIRPGFGMTETCAGSIYSCACPSYDLARGHEFASLGTCIPGMAMRVVSLTDAGKLVQTGETGALQVSGPVVFEEYYNDAKATHDAFTADGWFITGDLARIDATGRLHLTGRTKDSIIINGIKWSSTELEKTIEQENIPGLRPSFTAVFPTRAPNQPTEQLAVVYSPAFEIDDDRVRYETARAINKILSLAIGSTAAQVVPLDPVMLHKSSLFKLSRTKLRAALERGDFATYVEDNCRRIEAHAQSCRRAPETATEAIVQRDLAVLLGISLDEISTEASIFELGICSFNLILLKATIQMSLGTKVDIPMSVMLKEPTVHGISTAIDQLVLSPREYNSIVPLSSRDVQGESSSTPLFCIHPGSGDILVFIALAAHFPTRPVYAVRTRGFNPGERLFSSIAETAETYAAQIRETQPRGPYAIAGYSLGSTLAYEVSKILEGQGQEVRFLASIDYPPHIAQYVHHLTWADVLLHIAFFLELIDQDTMDASTQHVRSLCRDDALSYILTTGNDERITALALDKDKLELICDIAENFRVNAQSYEPIGLVNTIDVFVADPPHYAARDRQDWRENKLGPWANFARSNAAFHECPGIHAKMLNKEHVADFARIFKAAMRRRGV